MARTALPRRLTWQLARVLDIATETSSAKSILLDPPGWPGHQPDSIKTERFGPTGG